MGYTPGPLPEPSFGLLAADLDADCWREGDTGSHAFSAYQMHAYRDEEVARAVAAERERLASEVAGLHMAQSVNNQNYPSAWHDGVDAALEVIRGA